MEYSKDIILNIGTSKKEGQVQINFIKFLKKYKLMATVVFLCGILIVLDFILVHNFIVVLKKI